MSNFEQTTPLWSCYFRWCELHSILTNGSSSGIAGPKSRTERERRTPMYIGLGTVVLIALVWLVFFR